MSHQVLVYSGPGVSPLSLSHTLLTLSLLLVPNYTVQPATPELLSTQPWEPACALLVIPGGRDLPFVEELSKRTLVARRIREWVRNGGRYLGLCAGAYFASAEVSFDVGGSMEVKGERELAFYKGICRGPTYPGFAYAAESGSKAVNLVLAEGRSIKHIYYNGGGNFVSPPKEQIVARYETGEVAVVHIKEGKGQVLLCSVHPEYPLEDPPARDAIDKLAREVSGEERKRSEEARRAWCVELLQLIGLKTVDTQDESILLHPTHPSPIFVLSRDGIDPFAKVPKMTAQGEVRVLRDGNDELRITSTAGAKDLVDELARRRVTKPELPPLERLSLEPSNSTLEPPAIPDFHSIPKTVYIPQSQGEQKDGYSPAWTPLFNFETYWKAQRGKLGRMVLYAETVTSTQTMLDRNPLLLTHLPTPLAFLASFQLTGRGRGSNIWLSPAGCLQFSLLLTLPSRMSSKVVFVQYLMALAVSEAVDPTGKLGVRIKWPNDIYAEAEGVADAPSGTKGKAKLGGILVNTNLVNGEWRLVVGCGINVLNALPTFSLSQLHALHMARMPQSTIKPPTMEETFARIMDTFGEMWTTFAEEGQGFEPFFNEYYGRWLHREQQVTLTTTTPHQQVKIHGITRDHGLLRCKVVKEGSRGLTPLYDRGDFGQEDEFVDLQPDGNSFDMMSGLIKRKT